MHLYNEWLPSPLVESVERLEPARFAHLARSLEQTWDRARHQTTEEIDDAGGVEAGIYGVGQGRCSGATTLKWVPVVNSFLNTKTEFAVSDVEKVCDIALDVVLHTEDLFTQVRWGQTLVRMLTKYRDTVRITIQWRALYNLIRSTQNTGRQSYEGGTAMLQTHLAVFTSVVRRSRRFFPPGSAAEVWEQFRPGFADLNHNDAMEAAGFLSLFLPTSHARQLGLKWDDSAADKWSEWVKEWIELWDAVPHCQFWNLQWFSLLARCIKHLPRHVMDWEPHVPMFFTRVLNSFEVPVGKSQAQCPIQRAAPRQCVRMFLSGASCSLSKAVAKAVVLLIGPGSSVQGRFEKLVDFLEQYYHPSNGGSWTGSLERLLRYLVFYFNKRLAYEQRGEWTEAVGNRPQLGRAERKWFVTAVLKFVERAQFSKSGAMAGTAAGCVSQLAYVEPTIVLPFALSRFETAMETVTATHQLESAVTTLALCVRAILLAQAPSRLEEANGGAPLMDAEDAESAAADNMEEEEEEGEDLERHMAVGDYGVSLATGTELLAEAMLRTLPGIDANDPPKTLATFHFYCSVFSNIGNIGTDEEPGRRRRRSIVLPLDWSQWLEEFLSRLLTLLMHLEPNPESAATQSSTFLIEGGSPYRQAIELLFSRLSPALYQQGLRKVAKFVQTSVLPGAASEIGLLCLAVTNANYVEATSHFLPPIMERILSLLEGTPCTGGSGRRPPAPDGKRRLEKWPAISDALETSVTYHLNLLCTIITFCGPALVPYKEDLLRVITAAFDAPSSKICGGGKWVVNSLLGSLVHYYPVQEFKAMASVGGGGGGFSGVDLWIGTKGNSRPSPDMKPKWHIPAPEEVKFANQLLDLHLRSAIADLAELCGSGCGADDEAAMNVEGSTNSSGTKSASNGDVEREYFRVVLLRLDAVVRGVWTCLPDFSRSDGVPNEEKESVELLTVVGSSGVTVGSSSLREETAQVLHLACEYMMKERADDTANMMLLLRVMDSVVNFGSGQYGEWAHGKHAWTSDCRNLTEPRVNTMAAYDGYGLRRPYWLVVERVSLHGVWRGSQAGYRLVYASGNLVPPPAAVVSLAADLLKLSLHGYKAVRSSARRPLERILKRYPSLVDDCLPVLNESLSSVSKGSTDEAAMGACALYACRPIMRRITQGWRPMAEFVDAFLSSAHHETAKAQAAISEVFMFFVLRYSGVPGQPWNQKIGGGKTGVLGSYSQLVRKILDMVSQPSEAVHWRYTLMANTYLMLLMPPDYTTGLSGEQGLRRDHLAGHFLTSLGSDLPPLRPLALIALLLLLQKPCSPVSRACALPSGHLVAERSGSDQQPEQGSLGGEATRTVPGASENDVGLRQLLCDGLAEVIQREGFTATLLRNLALDHHLAEGAAGVGERTGSGGLGARAVDYCGVLIRSLGAWTMVKEWPQTKSWISFPLGSIFSLATAEFWERLVNTFAEFGAGAGHEEVLLCAVRGPLEQAIAAVDDRQRQCMAAECVAGLVHSGAPVVVRAWDSWLRVALRQALQQCTVELMSEWAACVRFAATGKGKCGLTPPTLRRGLVECLMEPLPRSAGSGQIVKRLGLLGACLGEMMMIGSAESPTNRESVVDQGGSSEREIEHDFDAVLKSTLLDELQEMMSHSARQVREAVGKLLAMLSGKVLQREGRAGQKSDDVAASVEKAKAFHRTMVAGALVASAKIQALGNRGGEAMEAAANASCPSPPPPPPSATAASDLQGADMMAETEGDIDPLSEDSDGQETFRWMETILYFVIASIKSGDVVCFTGTLVSLLYPLLSVQETSDHDFSILAKQALAYTKYQVLARSDMAAAVAALLEAAACKNWHTRAAALVFMQSFVYRHAFVLEDSDLGLLRATVLRLLSDPQLEVRELAASTLAGLLKGAEDEWAASVRKQCTEAAVAFQAAAKGAKKSQQRLKASAGTTTTTSAVASAAGSSSLVSARHGPVLGLAACVLSSPYDLPKWLPGVLMVIAGSSHEKPPIGTTVMKTFGEFKRTHADTWMVHGNQFSEEQLEVLGNLTIAPSYFV